MIDAVYTKYIDYKICYPKLKGISLQDFLIFLKKRIQFHINASGSFYILSVVIRNSQVSICIHFGSII